MQNPKGIAALIIAKKAGEPKSPSQEPNDHAEQIKAEAASEIMDAIKAGDHSALASALESFMNICMP